MFSLSRVPAFAALALALLVGSVAAGGCSGSGKVSASTAQEAFNKGTDAYENENYDRAISYFRKVFTYGRENEWADDAQLYLARSYRENERYLMAANQFKRFAQLYRSDERAARAQYERALALYRLSPDYELDQTQTKKALNRFRLFTDRYPQHEKTAAAEKKINELRGKLARKQLAAGRQYERRELWEAAAHAYAGVFDQYPDTRWVDEALLGSVRANVSYAERSIQKKKAERYRRAIESYQRLKQIFPDSPLLDEAEPLHETASKRLDALEEDNEADETLAGADG